MCSTYASLCKIKTKSNRLVFSSLLQIYTIVNSWSYSHPCKHGILTHSDKHTYSGMYTHTHTHTHIHTLSSNVHPCVCLRTVHTFMHTVLTHKHICTHSVYSLFMRKDLSTQMSLSLIIHTAHSLIHSDFSVCINYSLYSHMLLC